MLPDNGALQQSLLEVPAQRPRGTTVRAGYQVLDSFKIAGVPAGPLLAPVHERGGRKDIARGSEVLADLVGGPVQRLQSGHRGFKLVEEAEGYLTAGWGISPEIPAGLLQT